MTSGKERDRGREYGPIFGSTNGATQIPCRTRQVNRELMNTINRLDFRV